MKTLKNIIRSVKAALQKGAASVKEAMKQIPSCQEKARVKLAENGGNFAADSAIYIVLGVAVAIVAIGVVTGFIQNTLIPAIGNKLLSLIS